MNRIDLLKREWINKVSRNNDINLKFTVLMWSTGYSVEVIGYLSR